MGNKEGKIKTIAGGICAVPGFQAWGGSCGIRQNKDKKDLALIYSETDCEAAAVYTKNEVKAAPIYVTKEHLENGKARAVVVNSGNANACAPMGKENAQKECVALANALNIPAEDVIVASTGIIGVALPVECIVNAIPQAVTELSAANDTAAAEAILTTDTCIKQKAVQIDLDGTTVTIGAMAKGSGMIHPNMGTMLGFVGTDAVIDSALLQELLKGCTARSFNRISVDGDTSTNDMVCVLANGKAGGAAIKAGTESCELFREALQEVCVDLAKKIAGDGEGAGRLVTCTMVNAQTEEIAETLAKSVISSSLVKAAMFGKDANWGRVLCAMGYAGTVLKPELADVYFKSKKGSVKVCENGEGLLFDEELASAVLGEEQVEIFVDLKDGTASASAWGCDLTYDYVKINGDYRS